MRRGVVRVAALAGLAAGLGCQGIADHEFPVDRPIAVNYLEPQEARERAESLLAQAGQQPATRPGVARIDALASYAKQLAGIVEEEDERRFAGRLAFLHPLRGEIEIVEAAQPGAIPRSWSEDGRRLMFSQLVGDYRQLFEYDRLSGEVRPLTRGPAVHASGCYGPENRLVVSSARVEQGRAVSYIELTAPGGIEPKRISDGPADFAVACAPDGSAIAWVEQVQDGAPRIVTRVPPVDGQNRRIGPGRSPAFSADGRWIVYSHPRRQESKIYRVRPDGRGRRAVGRGVYDETQPALSPDASLVVYVADVHHLQTLYLRRFDGTGERLLFDGGGIRYPVW